jgi:hypothetical protein
MDIWMEGTIKYPLKIGSSQAQFLATFYAEPLKIGSSLCIVICL